MQLSLVSLLFFLTTFQLHAQIVSIRTKDVVSNIDSVRLQKLSVLDSTIHKLSKATEKVRSVTGSITSYDTLGQKAQPLQVPLNGEKSQVSLKVDSLKARGVSYDSYSQKLDRLNSINAMEGGDKLQSKAKGQVAAVQEKLVEGEDKIQTLQGSASGTVNEKLNVLSKESMGEGTLPSDVNLQGAQLPNADLNMNGTSLPTADVPKVPSANMDVKLPADANMNSRLEMPNVKKPEAFSTLNEKQAAVSTDVGDITGKVSGYSEDAKNLSTGNIDDVKSLKEDAMSKASLDEEMAALKEGEATIAEQKAQLNQLKNPEEFKKQTLARARTMVVKQMIAREKTLQETAAKVSKYQSKAGTVLNKRKDLPKRRDPLRKLKFYEKLVPGITMQVQKSGGTLLDANPSLRYRLTSYWSAGAGWNERFMLSGSSAPARQVRLYGLRAFTEVVLFKGISVRLDAERMNAFIRPSLQQQDVGQRQWTMLYMAGVKKEFTFMPKVVGNVQFMYNLYDPHHYRVYPTRFNVRFGFEFPLKARKK